MVSRGILTYTQQPAAMMGDKKVIPVEKGDWCSEAVLWTEWSHLGHLVAKTDVQLLALEAVKFQGIAIKFPCLQIKNYAVEFVSLLCSKRESEMTDLGNSK